MKTTCSTSALPSQIHLQVGFGFPDTVSAYLDNVSVFLSYLSMLPPSVYFLSMSEFCHEQQLIHQHKSPGTFAWLVVCWDGLFLELGGSGPWISTSFLGPCSLQGLIPWKCTKQIQELPKICSHEVHGCDIAFSSALSSQDPELYHLMVIAAQAAFDHHNLNEPFFLCMKCSRAPLFVVSSTAFVRKLSLVLSRNPMDWLCCVVLVF